MENKEQKEKDFYIDLLKFCINIKGEFTYKRLISSGLFDDKWKKDIVEKYLYNAAINKRSIDQNRYSNHDTIFLCVAGDEDFKSENNKYILGYDAKFKYIDYLELAESRRTAKRAFYTAVIAIIIAVITLLVSIYFSIAEINSSIKIDQNQFKEIKTLNISK